MKCISLIFLVLCSAIVMADEPQPKLTLNDGQRLRIREIEYHGQKILVQIYELQRQLDGLRQQGTQLQEQMNLTINDIAKENKIDREKFDFNMDTLAWTVKPQKTVAGQLGKTP